MKNKINILPLKGYKSLRALQAFHTLMLGMCMLPMYNDVTYDKFFEEFGEKSDEEKLKMIEQAALFVNLTQEEVEVLLSFCADNNGVPYQAANLCNLTPDLIREIVVAVCFEVGNIKIDLLNDTEKKK